MDHSDQRFPGQERLDDFAGRIIFLIYIGNHYGVIKEPEQNR